MLVTRRSAQKRNETGRETKKSVECLIIHMLLHVCMCLCVYVSWGYLNDMVWRIGVHPHAHTRTVAHALQIDRATV